MPRRNATEANDAAMKLGIAVLFVVMSMICSCEAYYKAAYEILISVAYARLSNQEEASVMVAHSSIFLLFFWFPPF